MSPNYCASVRPLFLGLAMACATVLLGESPATSVHVLSATLDPATHEVKVQLLNTTTDKTAVAYTLGIKGFDLMGKVVADSGIGWDFLSPDPTPASTSQYIVPGNTVFAAVPVPEQVVSVQVSVIGVVYLDRTFEGPASAAVFDTRSRQAREARQALAVLKSYPTTPSATRKDMQALLAIGSPLVSGVIGNKLHLAGLPDIRHPVAEKSLLQTKQQWDEIRAELTRSAVFFETQSEGVKQ
jgi:hypothetical protein